MKKISQIRVQNARTLSDKVGNRAEFARLLGMSDSYMWQILGDKQVRNIGNSIARRMEKACDKPEGWLDTEHPYSEKEYLKSTGEAALKPNETGLSDISLEALQVARAFDRIQSSAQRNAVVAQLRAFGIWD